MALVAKLEIWTRAQPLIVKQLLANNFLTDLSVGGLHSIERNGYKNENYFISR